MSQNNLPDVIHTDLSIEEQERLQKFMERGAPGFDLTDEVLISRMMDLYLAGKTYSQIARIHRTTKELVMLYSHKLNWYLLKEEYLQELELHLKGRVVNAKVASQDFLLQLSQMYQKKIGARMDKFLVTNVESEETKIDPKDVDKYLKIVEAIHKLASDPAPKSSKPTVGLNVGDGVTITKTGDNSVEITPKQKTMGSMLEILANQRRESELAKTVSSNDIKEDVTPTNNEGEKVNEKE